MTNYMQAKYNRKRGRNIKDGRRKQQIAVQTDSFWGVENFMPTRQPGQWIYTWQGINCLMFDVIETDAGEIVAKLQGGEIEIAFANTPHIDVKDFLDDQILNLMRLQADVDTALVVSGQEIGPEIPF
jgi:hypothetical protein